MDAAPGLDYFRKEHQNLLLFLGEWERALKTTASKNAAETVKGLNRLRELQPNLEAIRNHCCAEERKLEGAYSEYLEKGQFEELRHQHLELDQLLGDVLSELRFATVYEVERACWAGLELATCARRHIDFEEKLLGETARKLSEAA